MKLSASQIKAHNQAMALVNSDHKLSHDECLFILDNFQESANHINSAVGAFFTPTQFAIDFAYELPNNARIVDLCAGIGALAYFAYHFNQAKEITCVELNAEYIKVGKRILPEATWIQADALTFTADEPFDIAISNPPFGTIKTSETEKKAYTGSKFEYKIIEHASHIANHGAFIIPQASSGFMFSGQQTYSENKSTALVNFQNQTGIQFELSSTDTSVYLNNWKGVKPVCEVVTCTFPRKAKASDFRLAG